MTDHQRAEQGAKRKEWVKGDAEDWALLPVVKEPKSAKALTAPDLDTANDVLERWVVEVDAAPERALKPGLAAIQLKEWMRSREPKWREIKRAREIDAKFAERGQVPRRKGKESMEQMYERLSRELGEGHAA